MIFASDFTCWEIKMKSNMENNSNEVVEIDLKDLMFAVRHKWRPVLVVAIIMAVLLGGAKGTMTYRKQNDPETAKEAPE